MIVKVHLNLFLNFIFKLQINLVVKLNLDIQSYSHEKKKIKKKISLKEKTDQIYFIRIKLNKLNLV